ncbi:hypothetical protein [Mycobacterium sp. URHB0021]
MATTRVADLDLSVTDIARKLDRTGFLCLKDVVSPAWLAEARAGVDASLAEYGETDFCVVNPGREAGTPAHRFITDPDVRATMSGLVTDRWPRAFVEDEEIETVLRVLAGPERAATSYAFHYDATVITMLVPLYIPAAGTGRSGELVVFANKRPFRRSAVMNIVDKIAAQNPLYRKYAVRKLRRAPEKYSVVLEPGNVYLFWGYRTYHGNGPCATDTVRATLLLHLGDPHHGSPTINAAKALKLFLAPSSERTEATVERL